MVNQQRSKFVLLDFPQISSIVQDKSNITVSWIAPFDGECSVTRYTVYYRVVERMTSSSWKKVTASSYQLKITLQLRCGKRYQIAVTAWSAFGETTRNQSKLVSAWGGNNSQKRSKNVQMLLFIVVSVLGYTLLVHRHPTA